MGSTIFPSQRAASDDVAEVIRERKGTLASRGRDGTWYLAPNRDGRKVICFALMRREPHSLGVEVKYMDETAGPCYYDCPVKLIEQADPPIEGTYAAEWRAEVLQLAAEGTV